MKTFILLLNLLISANILSAKNLRASFSYDAKSIVLTDQIRKYHYDSLLFSTNQDHFHTYDASSQNSIQYLKYNQNHHYDDQPKAFINHQRIFKIAELKLAPFNFNLTSYPLGYVDGMSLYGGYFAEGFGLDPSGTSAEANRNRYKHQIENYKKGVEAFKTLEAKLKEKCKKCCPEICLLETEAVVTDPESLSECEKDAKKAGDAIKAAWEKWWGQDLPDGVKLAQGKQPLPHTPRKGSDHVGGYFCWDWSRIFYNALSGAGLKTMTFKEQYFLYQGRGSTKNHFYVEIAVCYNDTDACKVLIDDGFFFSTGFIHDKPWPVGAKGSTGKDTDIFDIDKGPYSQQAQDMGGIPVK